MKVQRPRRNPPELLRDGRPTRKYNPRKQWDIYNHDPKLWPVRYNSAVYHVDEDTETIHPGRVAWYHPARQIDASCCITAGQPFYKITNGRESDSRHPGNVFEFSDNGWLRAVARLSQVHQEKAEALSERAQHAVSQARAHVRARDALIAMLAKHTNFAGTRRHNPRTKKPNGQQQKSSSRRCETRRK